MAQAAPASPASPSGPAGLMQSPMIMMLLICGVMYLLLIRPQMKKQKEVQKMLSELKKGDDVVTSGGMIGRIAGIKDDVITLQVQEGVRIQVLRSAVSGRQGVKPAGETAKVDVKAT